MDPITDIFRTMHVTAFGQHRLEATAPWGLIQERQTEEKVTPSDKKMSPTDLAHFAMLSRGNCWLSVEGTPEPIPLTGGDCILLARGTSFVLRDGPRTRPRRSFREIARLGARGDDADGSQSVDRFENLIDGPIKHLFRRLTKLRLLYINWAKRSDEVQHRMRRIDSKLWPLQIHLVQQTAEDRGSKFFQCRQSRWIDSCVWQ